MDTEPTQTFKVFICYARKDRILRNALVTHLSILKNLNLIEIWFDREIRPGVDWKKEIDVHLNTAQIILLLISPHFMDSDYCYGVEMKQALDKESMGTARVIPVLLRPVLWEFAPFSTLQVLPTNAKPVTLWQNQDEALKHITKKIFHTIKELQNPTQAGGTSFQKGKETTDLLFPTDASTSQLTSAEIKSLVSELSPALQQIDTSSHQISASKAMSEQSEQTTVETMLERSEQLPGTSQQLPNLPITEDRPLNQSASTTSPHPTISSIPLPKNLVADSLYSSQSSHFPHTVQSMSPKGLSHIGRILVALSILTVGLIWLGSLILLPMISNDYVISLIITTPTFSLHPKVTAAMPEQRFKVNAISNDAMFGFNSAHTHQNIYERTLNRTNILHLRPDWLYPTGILGSSAAVANSVLYIGSSNHKFYAFNALCKQNCQPLWVYATGGIIDSSPAVANGIVYIGSWDNKLYAFNALCKQNCQPLWSYATRGIIVSSPAVANGVVFVGSEDNRLYAFSLE